jgi:hypothetical protein
MSKTKALTFSKQPLRNKLEVQVKVMNFKYLGVEVTSDGSLQSGANHQAYEAARLSGCLNDTVC